MVHTPGASTSVMYDNYDECVRIAKHYASDNPGRTFTILEVIQALTAGTPERSLGMEQNTLQ
jgi:hypothetical protein